MGFNFWLAPWSKNGLVFSQPRIKSKALLLYAYPRIMCIFMILANQANQTAFYFQAQISSYFPSPELHQKLCYFVHIHILCISSWSLKDKLNKHHSILAWASLQKWTGGFPSLELHQMLSYFVHIYIIYIFPWISKDQLIRHDLILA